VAEVAPVAPPLPRMVPAPPAFYPAPPNHAGAGDGGASESVLERVIAQQLQLMGQQLSAIRGEAPSLLAAPAETASAPASHVPPVLSAPAAVSADTRSAGGADRPVDAPSRNGGGTHEVAPRVVPQSPRAKIEPPTFVAFQPVNAEGAGGFTPRQREFLDDFVARYTERTKGSKAHQAHYHRALADTRVTARFRRAWKEMLYPIVSSRALGSKIWDVDGNEYVDTGMAFGCNLFGHAPDFVSKAIRDQVERGYGVGPQSPHAGRAAELICELGGNDRAVFCNSGTEAVMGAIRAARTFTGRSKIAYFSGSYHGWADVMLGRLLPGEKRLVKPAAPGIPDLPLGDVMMLDWDEPSSLELLARHIDELALVMVEPVQSRRLDIQPRAFIQEVRRITSEAGALLLFDELITGFRVLPGGAQAYFGVKADLVTYGKIVAGGLPMGVVSGREEVMAVFDGGMWSYGDDSYPTSQRTVFAGAFFKHPLSMAVAVSILEEIRRQGVPMYDALNGRTERLVDRINAFFEAERYPATVVRFASSFRFFFGPEVQFPDLFNHHLVHEGIYMIPETGTHFLSTAHTDEDLERYYRAVVASARALRRGGFIPEGPDGGGEPDPEPEPAPSRVGTGPSVAIAPPTSPNGKGPVEAGAADDAGVRTLPISEGQRQLWIESQMGDDANCAYIESSSLRLRGLDVEAMRGALQALVARHDTLRMTFDVDGETQRIHPTMPVDVPVEDLRAVPPAEREEALAEWVRTTVQRPFDLVNGPLIRFGLAALAGDEHVLTFTFHHAALDGWSAGVVTADLSELYAAAVQGRPPRLAPRPDHGELVRTQVSAFRDGSPAEEYWRARFAGGVPVLELPTDRPRPAVRSYVGGRVERMAEMDLLARLSAAGRRHGLTMFNTLLAAVFVWLERVTGQDDLVVGTPAAGQATRPGAAEMVGFDINVLPIRARVDPASSFAEQARRIRREVMGAIEHQQVSIPHLVETLLRTRVASRPPLFSVLMHLDRADGSSSLGGLPAQQTVNFGGGSKVDLTFDLNETPDGLSLRLIYATALFDDDTAARWLASFQRMLEAIAADPEQRVSDLALTGPEERRQVVEWNRTEHPYPHACIHALFEAQADLTPNAVAVVCGAERVTYAELDARANRLARHLRRLGVGAEDRVALCLERGPEMMVAFLGILKAGAAYVPLDATHPADRLAYMLRDSGARLLVTQQTLLSRLPAERPDAVLVDAQAAEIAAEPAERVESGVGPENLAYVYYTSGSTGRPKGVAMHHYGPANYFAWGREAYGAGVGRGAPVFSSMAVDLTLANFLPLFTGAAVELLPEGPGVEPLADALRAGGGFGMIKITPTHLALLNHALTPAQAAASTATLVVGADNLFAEPTVFWQRHAPEVRLLNEYGPTETVVGCSLYALPAGKHVDGRVPIGRPIWNLTMYVLDGALHPVPPAIPGELYIGGVGVARGYLGRPGLTAEKFVPDPFASAPGARLYRTGDRARFLADGNLEFLGRVDFQVKIRGYRVEPGEVESVLSAHPGVRSALVIPREDEPGDLRLVAYVVPDGPAAASADELRSALRERLPEHMVPSAFVFMDDFPTGSTGKVDRKALPAPEKSGPDDGYAAPRTPVEETLAGIWAALLRVERVGVRDDFFALGGHSLLATRVVSHVRQVFGVELSLRALFEAPTVAGLAARVESLRRTDVPPLPPVLALDRSGPLPLSFAQERLWFLDRLQPGGTFYNVPVPLRLEGALDTGALERALGEIVRRHEVLRTTLREVDGSPVQVIAPFDGFHLPIEDLSALDADDREAELKRRAAAEAAATFDLAAGPLFRAQLLRLGAEDHALLLGMHHVVNDEWSVDVLFREMAALYEAYRQGGESPLPDLPVQYADHAVWQRAQVQGEALDRSLSWWRGQLAGAPELLDLPTDRPRPAMQSYRGAFEPIDLPRALHDRLEALARREGTTLFMVLLAAFDVLLSRYSGSEDIVVGTTIAGRTRAEVEPLIGLFMNTLVLRTDLSGAGDFREVLRRVREVTLGAYEHQEIPFERLVSELRPERNLGHSPLFQVLLELHNTESAGTGLPGLSVRGVEMEATTSKLDLNVALRATPEGLVGGMNYSTDLFDPSTARRLVDHLARVLEQVADDAAIRLSELTLVDAAERAQLVERWNQTAAVYPADSTIHALFEKQASRTPDAVAVTFGGESLTYRELDARANQVAHHLQRLGVGPEVRVGICLERSLELLPCILGVMKAGGAYVPVDPAHPAERIGYVLSDSAVPVLLTQSHLAASVPVDASVTVISVDTARDTISAESIESPRSAVTSENLAYVIYTSGSTGRPKGVAMHHRGVANYIHWGVRAYGANLGNGSPVFSSMAVDLTVTNLLPLFAGRTVHLLPEENAVEALAAALREKPGFGLIKITPVHLSLLTPLLTAEEAWGAAHTLVIGADFLSAEPTVFWQENAPGVRLMNEYGPTETVVGCSAYALPNGVHRHGPVPVGGPIQNLRFYVLDAHGQPVPAGLPGELYIGGAGVARGYLGRPGLTAEKFVPEPFGEPGARMYRTGDRARWQADGELLILGRTDNQVKIRGYRVELGEIEAVLRRHPSVTGCLVVVREDVPGDKRLVAYVAVDGDVDSADSADSNALREHVRASLPEYMMPAAFVVMAALPQTATGKIDPRTLPAPEYRAADARYVAPQTPVEETLAEIWEEMLNVDRAGLTDDFFTLGGHSLLAMRLLARIRSVFGVELSIRSVFSSRTLEAVAAEIEQLVLEMVLAMPDDQAEATLALHAGAEA
ncbi:MAG: tycC2, partial [Gemmatimonadetes bacterium]|nr:tycC2 [Gemmatimonadota bacterium]